MKFETAKNTTLGLLLSGLAIGVLGIFLCEEGSAMYNLTIVATLVLLAGGCLVGAIWARCPYCGKHLFVNMLKHKTCPKCRRALTTPRKIKKK